MVTATARNPVQDRAVSAAAATVTKQFDAELMGEVIPCEITATADPNAATAAAAPAAAPAATEPTSQALAPTGASVPMAASRYADDSFTGDWDESDIQFPTLSIVQGSSGALVEAGFPTGTLVLGQDELFPAPRPNQPPQVLRFIPMKIEKSFRENVTQEEYQSGMMPRLVKTKQEVLDLGGTLAWGPGGEKPTWGPSARCVFLIEAPKDTEHPGFGIELENKLYAVGVYYAKSGSYKTTAATLFNCYQTVLFVNKLGPDGKPLVVAGTSRFQKEHLLYKAYWHFTWKQEKSGNFNPWKPRVTLTRDETSPVIREFISNIVSPSDAVSGEE